MTATSRLCKLLFFLLLLSASRTEAQEGSHFATLFTDVQQIPLQKENGENTFVQLNSAPLQLFIFLSPECPLCKNYSIVLNALQQQFGTSVQLTGIVPGSAYTATEVQAFVKDFKILFPVYTDPVKRFSDYTKAAVTPEAVLLNNKGQLVYRGAIDDWVQDLGKKKLKPQQHYLEDAIRQYLQGAPVTVKSTTPKGCLINEF